MICDHVYLDSMDEQVKSNTGSQALVYLANEREMSSTNGQGKWIGTRA